MKLAIMTYSRAGCRTARRLMTFFPDAEKRAYTMERFHEDGFLPYEKEDFSLYTELFSWADAMIFICACGIAVRKIAPHIRDKHTDPAVVCLDDSAHFVIPLLSGHIGGANELAGKIAASFGSVAVITTATDVNNKFASDTWATKNGFIIDDMALAKAVSATILEKDIPLLCDFPLTSDYPDGVVHGESGELGIYIGYNKKSPFDRTLCLISPVLHLGIGCRRGTSAEAITSAVDLVLSTHNIDKRAIKCVSSIDIKAEESGLLEYCRKNNLPVHFYTADELRAVSGEFTSSSFVKSITGVDNICERAAMAEADKLIVRKTAVSGVTVAVAEEYTEVCFG